MQHYQHLPLHGRRTIRLLQLEPTKSLAAPIKCTLQEVSLDANPRYEAISYSWDGQVSDRILHLQDETDDTPRQLLVTENCEDAIRALQRDLCRNTPLHIWIDAISINQANVQERNSQVSMMGDIYKHAFTVRIWLGHATHDSYAALRVLLALMSDKNPSPDKLSDIGEITLRAFLIRQYSLSDSAEERHR